MPVSLRRFAYDSRSLAWLRRDRDNSFIVLLTRRNTKPGARNQYDPNTCALIITGKVIQGNTVAQTKEKETCRETEQQQIGK